MKITSPAFFDHALIPTKYTCEGENIHPPLIFEGIPKNAKSLVIVVSDPDAPNGDFTHWLLWNVKPTVGQLDEGVVPEDACEGQNDFGDFTWDGPCPPSGMHRYEFCLYALDSMIDLPITSNKTDLLSHISGFIVAEALLTGLYTRNSL